MSICALEKLMVGGVEVTLASPSPVPDQPFQGRADALDLLMTAALRPPGMPKAFPLIVGPPGVGKTSLVHAWVQALGALPGATRPRLWTQVGYDGLESEELLLRMYVDSTRQCRYALSPLASSLLADGPAVCYFDDIGLCRPGALSLLTSLLDTRRRVSIPSLNVEIEASKEEWQFVAAISEEDLPMLPGWLKSRLSPTLHLRLPEAAELSKMIASHYPDAEEDVAGAVELIVGLWKKLGNSAAPPTPRIVLHVLAFATRLARRVSEDPSARFERRHVERAFKEVVRGGEA